MCTTNGKWVMNLLRNFDFIKVRIEEHLSTSMLPIICTMVSLANFTYFGMLETSTQDVITRCHIWSKDSREKGATHVIAFDFIMSLNMPC